MGNWSLYLLVGVGLLVAFNLLRQRFGAPPEFVVPAPDGKPLIIDVRQGFEFRGGHVVGAINVPTGWIGRVAEQLGPKDRPIVVYCQSGSRSSGARRALQQAGFTAVTDLGGLAAVRAAGHRFE